MRSMLVVAPHADDETLGCGGTILRSIDEGVNVHWLLVTNMSRESGFSDTDIQQRNNEIRSVHDKYGFASLRELNLPPAQLDTIPTTELIDRISAVVHDIKPEQVLVPYRNDAHSDHERVYDASMSVLKSFRCPFVRRILAYETMSETEFGFKPEDPGFKPNVFVDISQYLNPKLEVMAYYRSELKDFPFPRSKQAISALAQLRGAQSNVMAAEAFMLLKELC